MRNYTADHVSTRTYATQAALTLATDGLVCGRIEGSTERGSRQRHTPTSDFTERLRTQASFFHSASGVSYSTEYCIAGYVWTLVFFVRVMFCGVCTPRVCWRMPRNPIVCPCRGALALAGAQKSRRHTHTGAPLTEHFDTEV